MLSDTTRKAHSNNKLKELNNVDEICHYLSLMGYYRKFVPLFADVTKSFNKLLIKALFVRPILQYSNIEKSCTLFTDISHYANSGVFTQAVEGPDNLRPIAYTSGSFSGMLQNSLQLKNKLLQSIHLLHCDHKPLETFLSKDIKMPKVD